MEVKVRDKSTTQYDRNFDFKIGDYEYNWNPDFNATDFISNDANLDKMLNILYNYKI